jgi:hypothetical protein
MPIPLIPIIAALAAGGTLVPHAAGGMIVTSAAGYVAGTYLTTSAIAGLIAGATATTAAGLTLAFSSMKGIIGANLARTAAPTVAATTVGTGTVAATGWISVLTGPIAILLTTVGAVLLLGYGIYRFIKLKRKVAKTTVGEEAQFTDNEARIVERIIKRLAKKSRSTINSNSTEGETA